MIGELIDHYRVLELVGRGAMGVVYKALDVNLDRPVAIKVMSAEARNDPDFVERFRQEARVQGALNHPNVALLFDYFLHDGAPVAVMEFIDGESLEQLIRRQGPIPAHAAIPLFKQALRGVAAAHRSGIVHRDLKPSNLMITRDDVVKVMDFGIAKRQGATGATKVSTSIGSPLYMAPEQILGRAVDCRTDIYCLGTTLYELLSGQRPFNPRGKAEYFILNAHVNELPEPPTVHCRDIPQPIVDAVMRSLAKDPDARFQSADDFMRALPDVPAPDAAAPRVVPSSKLVPETAPNKAAPRVGPTGTLVLQSARNTAVPSGTLAIEYSPPRSAPVATRDPGSTMAFEYTPSTPGDPHDVLAFDYSAQTLRHGSVHRAAPAASATVSPGLMRLTRAARPAIVAVLVATLALGTLVQYAQRGHAALQGAPLPSSAPRFTHAQASPATQTSTSTEAAVPPGDQTAPTAAPPATTLATTTAPARQDLAGTWRGEYVDASGKQLLRVVGLSINRVQNDGGIEGTLQYEAASGDGECRLHPRGSTYSADEQRLQLSPEGCSPHYPKELGVPLDFDGVNPRANMLRDGHIEAPTGEAITVKLERVRGV